MFVRVDTEEQTFALIGRTNQMSVGRNQMVEMNRMVEGQSGKTDVMMTAEGWEGWEGSSGHHKENEPDSSDPPAQL